MKRLALLMVLLLALPALACADSDDTMSEYENTAESYRLRYPAQWVMMDRDTIDGVIQRAESGELDGLDLDALTANREYMQQFQLAVCMATDLSLSCDIMIQPNPEGWGTSELIEKSCPSALSVLMQLDDAKAAVSGELRSYGDVEYACIEVSGVLESRNVIARQLLLASGTRICVMTFWIYPDDAPDMDALEAQIAQMAASMEPGWEDE